MSKEEQKPQEFWIPKVPLGDFPPVPPEDCIHVIEYSSYQKLKRVIESYNLQGMVDSASGIVPQVIPFTEPNFIETLRQERDDYRAALEDADKTLLSESGCVNPTSDNLKIREVLAKYPSKESK